VKRWGPGTTKERVSNSETAKEIQERMAALNAERAKQDQMWNTVETTETEGKKLDNTTNTSSNLKR
jgi:hypothetical protein